MKEESKLFLKNLLNTSSPSGFEGPALDVWKEYISPYVDNISSNSYGNTIAHLGPFNRAPILLCGHIDEIGLMVRYINDDGFIYFSLVGGVDRINLIGKQITIYNKCGQVKGVIARKAAHLLEDDDEETVPRLHTLFIDIGSKSADETESMVSVGDPITIDSVPAELLNNRIVGRGLDNRVGAWVVAETIRVLSILGRDKHPAVKGLASVQEEIGLHGAVMGAEETKPCCAIVIDLTHCTDIPNSDKEKNGHVEMGKGPVIFIGSVIDKHINAELEEVANEQSIPIQKSISPEYTGTDADAIFLKRGGIPTSLVSIPNRYMHSPVEMVQLEDLDNTVKLIVGFCKKSMKRGI